MAELIPSITSPDDSHSLFHSSLKISLSTKADRKHSLVRSAENVLQDAKEDSLIVANKAMFFLHNPTDLPRFKKSLSPSLSREAEDSR